MKTDLEWAEELAEKYDILPRTVLEIHSTLTKKLYVDGKYLNHKERTERFLKLYFEGVNEK